MTVIKDLCRLAKDFKSGDPVQAAALRKEAKAQSFNDLSRVVVYLMEVVGATQEHSKNVQAENADLKELLTLNGVKLDEGDDIAPSTEGPNGMAASGDNQNSGSGRSSIDSGTGSRIPGEDIAAQTK